MKQCSVIVPLYRGKEYLDACIESIVAQTFSDWELILMDDGSPDDTYDFASALIARYPDRDIRLYRRENRGVAETRNECVLLASGTYVAFMDQDDTLLPDYLQRLTNAAQDTDADIALCGYLHQRDDGKVLQRVTLTSDSWSKYRVITPWARIYKRSFLIENDLKYLTTPCGEDAYLTIRAYAHTERIAVVEGYAGYVWRYNRASVSNTKQKSASIVDTTCDTFERILASLPEKRCSKPEDEEFFFIRSCVFWLLFSSNAESGAQVDYAYHRYFSFLESHFPSYRKNKYVSLLRPRSERFAVRCAVWSFLLLHRIGLAKPFLRLWCRPRKR